MKNHMKTLTTAATRRIVTAPMGSWRWQNAYKIATYGMKLAKNGKVLWESVGSSRKLSYPQIESLNLDHLAHGSLHNKPVLRTDAIYMLGISRVRSIEKRGFSFK